jgi:hypothetical protein
MKINSHPNKQSLISEVKYSAATFTVDVESDGWQLPIDIVFEYRTIIGHGSNIVRIDFEVAFDTFWFDGMGRDIRDVIYEEIERVFPNEDGSACVVLMDTIMEMIKNFQNNILDLKE